MLVETELKLVKRIKYCRKINFVQISPTLLRNFFRNVTNEIVDTRRRASAGTGTGRMYRLIMAMQLTWLVGVGEEGGAGHCLAQHDGQDQEGVRGDGGAGGRLEY